MSNIKRRWHPGQYLRVAALGLMTLVAACGSTPGSNGGSSQPSPSGPLPTLRVVGGSQIPDPIEAYLYVAQAQGFFKKAGVQVDYTIASTGTVGISQTVAGQSDVFFGGMDPLPAANAGGSTIEMIYNQWYSPLWSMAYFSSHYNSISSLKGANVGVVSASSASIPLFKAALARANLTMSDVNAVAIGQAATSLAAIKAGRVDAAVWTTPWYAYLNQAKISYKRQDIPGTSGNYPGEGLAATPATVNSKKDTLVKFVSGFIEGQKYCLANVNRCARIYKSAAGDTVNSEALIADQIKIGQGLAKLPAAVHGVYGASDASFWQVMLNAQEVAGVIKTKPDPNTMFTNSIVNAANK